LEGTSKGCLVQPCCNEQGHLQLDQDVAANAISGEIQILIALLIVTFWLWLKCVTWYAMFDLHESQVKGLIGNTSLLLVLLWCFAIANVAA